MTDPRSAYVLVTPARNEEATIAHTLASVLAQVVPPREWIIVSDGSTDATEEIINRFAAISTFPLRLVSLKRRPVRNFASVVFALEAGIAALNTDDFKFIGFLDADVSFAPTYFRELIQRFHDNPRLGLGGGIVIDVVDGKRDYQRQSLRDVAGAAHFFRRECYRSLGSLVPIPEGGWDAITNVVSRLNGFETHTFPDLPIDHLKPRNSAQGGWVRRKWQLGVRDYALGYGSLFELIKSMARWRETPIFLGSFCRFGGYFASAACRRKRLLSPHIVSAVRHEQYARLFGWLRRFTSVNPQRTRNALRH